MTPDRNASPSTPRKRRALWPRLLGIVLVLLVVGVFISRAMEARALKSDTEEQAHFTVATIAAKAGPASEEVILPGNVQAWHDAPIYARTNGYLKKWYTDIGAPVKAGTLLAVIEAPEVDAQLHQAEADLATAQANYNLAATTAVRWRKLLKTDSVSKQEGDEKISDEAAKKAALESARANRDRLTQEQGFERVTAPFDGVITARNVDVGALINAGNGGGGMELFHIAQTDRLRVYVQIPETYTQHLDPHLTADLRFNEHPGKRYQAALASTADALDPVTRTLLAQFATDNKSGELLAGGYVEAHLKLSSGVQTVRLPANTLMFRAQGLTVATVDADKKVTLVPVKLGRDFGNEVEVLSGINPGDTVVINPPDSLTDGVVVELVKSDAQTADAAKSATPDSANAAQQNAAKKDGASQDALSGPGAQPQDQDKDKKDSGDSKKKKKGKKDAAGNNAGGSNQGDAVDSQQATTNINGDPAAQTPGAQPKSTANGTAKQ